MRPWKLLVFLAATAMLVSVLGVVPATASHGANGTVCLVNSGGDPGDPFTVGDRDVQAIEAMLHVDVEIRFSQTEADVIAAIDQFVTSAECDLIMALGFISGFVIEAFAANNPDQYFAVIDSALSQRYDNVAEVGFDVDQGAFLAGYIAAGVSETGKVGVFGGLPFPPVTLFMDGYAFGVDYYNAEYGTSVEVLGWDPDTQSGLFTFTFGDPTAGQAAAASLYDLGADTVFPVAGFTSLGALFEASERKAAGEEVRVVGVDYDWAGTFGDPERLILTSVLKSFAPAVYNQVAAFVDGSWEGGFVFYGLESGATEIAPFHKLNPIVPGFLKNDLKELRAGIIDGTIPTAP